MNTDLFDFCAALNDGTGYIKLSDNMKDDLDQYVRNSIPDFADEIIADRRALKQYRIETIVNVGYIKNTYDFIGGRTNDLAHVCDVVCDGYDIHFIVDAHAKRMGKCSSSFKVTVLT